MIRGKVLAVGFIAIAEASMAGGPVMHSDGSVTWNPPAEFDHAFSGNETIYQLPQSQVPEACADLFEKAGLNIKVSADQKGCAAYKGTRGYIIVMDRAFGGVTPEAAIRHERGHLNGWPADHPD